MDFKQRNPSKGELKRFFDRFGEEKLVDRTSKRFEALGLRSAFYGNERWLEIAWRLWQDRLPYDEERHLRQHALRVKPI